MDLLIGFSYDIYLLFLYLYIRSFHYPKNIEVLFLYWYNKQDYGEPYITPKQMTIYFIERIHDHVDCRWLERI